MDMIVAEVSELIEAHSDLAHPSYSGSIPQALFYFYLSKVAWRGWLGAL